MADLSNTSVLVLGAGGLGCEILKNLSMAGIPKIHVVDMDTIELTNLNRQFLFHEKDIGKPKAIVAANYINARKFPSLNNGSCVEVTPYFRDLTTFDVVFLSQFTMVISGLDSIEARRFINGQLINVTLQSGFEKCIPLIDGGSEGFKGHCKTIIPGFTACYECSIGTLPTRVQTYPLCTVANNPRLPEHVVEYIVSVKWPEEFPARQYDYDSYKDIDWIKQQCLLRAREFSIDGSALTTRFILGVIKNIIPSVASTNAIIAGQCCNEAIKLLYDIYQFDESPNFMIYNGDEGCFSYSFTHERLPDCPVCGVLS